MDVGRVLRDIERKIAEQGYSAAGAEFWRLVREVKKDPALAEKYAGRIGAIDQGIFRERTLFTVPYPLGNLLAAAGIALSFWLIFYGARGDGAYPLLFAAASALLLSTSVHPVAHIAAGRLSGMRFTFYFLDGPIKVEPTVKVDYGTYLRAAPSQRMIMHLAGPIATVLSPLALMLVSISLGYAFDVIYLLLGISLFFLATEFIPLILVKLGSPILLGLDFRKSDVYRAMREGGMV